MNGDDDIGIILFQLLQYFIIACVAGMRIGDFLVDTRVTHVVQEFPSSWVGGEVFVNRYECFVGEYVCGCPYVYKIVFGSWVVF